MNELMAALNFDDSFSHLLKKPSASWCTVTTLYSSSIYPSLHIRTGKAHDFTVTTRISRLPRRHYSTRPQTRFKNISPAATLGERQSVGAVKPRGRLGEVAATSTLRSVRAAGLRSGSLRAERNELGRQVIGDDARDSPPPTDERAAAAAAAAPRTHTRAPHAHNPARCERRRAPDANILRYFKVSYRFDFKISSSRSQGRRLVGRAEYLPN
ncbi:hypothetical protein JYU34_007777 [Plutella xylostella]|uniref:Uncharacterized protein n=1 Tax=Plutella xylostella TaxID=51655 RepID=A0ABQ7QR65_PLUXY|nr:hypothetical protein JYU34_007777 [Plutella xylostella]